MTVKAFSSIDTAKQGRDLYDQKIGAQVEQAVSNRGKLLALDVDSGDYCLADSSLTAVKSLKERRPEARVHVMRVGHPTAVRIGASHVTASNGSCE